MINDISEIIEEIHGTKGNLNISSFRLKIDSDSKGLISYHSYDKLDRLLHVTTLTEILIHLANRND